MAVFYGVLIKGVLPVSSEIVMGMLFESILGLWIPWMLLKMKCMLFWLTVVSWKRQEVFILLLNEILLQQFNGPKGNQLIFGGLRIGWRMCKFYLQKWVLRFITFYGRLIQWQMVLQAKEFLDFLSYSIYNFDYFQFFLLIGEFSCSLLVE